MLGICLNHNPPLFPLGKTVMTPSAINALAATEQASIQPETDSIAA
jgi:hypothetical protein